MLFHALQAALSSAITVIQAAIVVFMVAGERILPFVNNAAVAQLYDRCKDKRIQVGLGTWFIGNLIKQQLSSTGALEIFFDGQLVISSAVAFAHHH